MVHEVEVDLGEAREMFGGTEAYNNTRGADVIRGMENCRTCELPCRQPRSLGGNSGSLNRLLGLVFAPKWSRLFVTSSSA